MYVLWIWSNETRPKYPLSQIFYEVSLLKATKLYWGFAKFQKYILKSQNLDLGFEVQIELKTVSGRESCILNSSSSQISTIEP